MGYQSLVLHVNQFENTTRMMQPHALKLSLCLSELAGEGISFTALASKINLYCCGQATMTGRSPSLLSTTLTSGTQITNRLGGIKTSNDIVTTSYTDACTISADTRLSDMAISMVAYRESDNSEAAWYVSITHLSRTMEK